MSIQEQHFDKSGFFFTCCKCDEDFFTKKKWTKTITIGKKRIGGCGSKELAMICNECYKKTMEKEKKELTQSYFTLLLKKTKG